MRQKIIHSLFGSLDSDGQRRLAEEVIGNAHPHPAFMQYGYSGKLIESVFFPKQGWTDEQIYDAMVRIVGDNPKNFLTLHRCGKMFSARERLFTVGFGMEVNEDGTIQGMED